MTQQTWRWNADLFEEMKQLDRFGAEGWEVERIDKLARFVCHRDDTAARRWEYRRVEAGEAERMVADGWELCGGWFRYAYFKRATGELPGGVPAVPAKKVYFSVKGGVLIALSLVLVVCGVGMALAGIGDTAITMMALSFIWVPVLLTAVLVSRRRD